MEITGFDFGYEILIILLRIAEICCDLGIYVLLYFLVEWSSNDVYYKNIRILYNIHQNTQ